MIESLVLEGNGEEIALADGWISRVGLTESKVDEIFVHRYCNNGRSNSSLPNLKRAYLNTNLQESYNRNVFSKVETLELGEDVTMIPQYEFCIDGIRIIKVDALTPPSYHMPTFLYRPTNYFTQKTFEEAVLIVPEEAYEAYSKAEPWCRFNRYTNIEKYFYQDFSHIKEDFDINKAQLAIGVTADGESQILLDCQGLNFDSENLTFNLYCSDANSLDVDLGNLTLMETNDGTKVMVYTAPKDYLAAKENYTVMCEIVDKVAGKFATTDIRVYRPGLLLVHGLNSNDECWRDFYQHLLSDGKYSKFTCKNVNYERTNTRDFKTNSIRLYADVKLLATNMESKGIACSKFDFIGHSMGGILSRMVQHARPDAVNKIITVNTPHSGSQLADLVKSVRFYDRVYNLDEWFKHNDTWRAKYEAVTNLQTTSYAIQELNSSGNLNRETQVKAHAIVSSMIFSDDDKTEPFAKYGQLDLAFDVLRSLIIPGYFMRHVLPLTLENELNPYTQWKRLNKIFGEEKHDGIVSLTSQTGGLAGVTVTPFNAPWAGAYGWSSAAHHTNIYKNVKGFEGYSDSGCEYSPVWQNLENLLSATKESNMFNDGFCPKNLSSKNFIKRMESVAEDAKLDIESFNKAKIEISLKVKTDKETYLPGDTIFYSIDSPLGGAQEYLIWTTWPINDMSQIVCGGKDGKLVLPNVCIDQEFMIEAMTVDDDETVHWSSPKELNVDLFNGLEDVVFDSPMYCINVGESITPNAHAELSGDQEVEIDAEFEAEDPNIVEVSGSIITGLQVGETKVWAKYFGRKDFVTVRVVENPHYDVEEDVIADNKFDLRIENNVAYISITDIDESEALVVQCVGVDGKVCFSRRIGASVCGDIAVPLDNLNAGVYILNVTYGNCHQVLKSIVR